MAIRFSYRRSEKEIPILRWPLEEPPLAISPGGQFQVHRGIHPWDKDTSRLYLVPTSTPAETVLIDYAQKRGGNTLTKVETPGGNRHAIRYEGPELFLLDVLQGQSPIPPLRVGGIYHWSGIPTFAQLESKVNTPQVR
jgi:hypothetical protein